MKVKIEDYSPDWVRRFQDEKKLIAETLGNKILSVEHIGSTAVPGLGAKPIVDILLGVRKISDADEFIPIMTQLGYEYRDNYEHIMPYRRYFTKPGFYHIHTVEVTSEFWRRHLLFRDYLKSHDDAGDAYYKTKMELAQRDWNDGNDYALAKTDFIQKAERDALKYFTSIAETAECEAAYRMYNSVSKEEKKSCGITAKRFGTATAIRTDIFPGFTHNRVPGLGLENTLDEKTLLEVKEFYRTSKNIYALQLVPQTIDDESKELLNRHGFVFKKNWVRFYRDVSPIENVKTDLTVKEIGKEHGNVYGEIITRIFGFPSELSCAATSVIGRPNWKHYMAFDGSKPVTTGSVFFNGDIAWIGFAATEQSHRGRGGQAAVLAERINAAREYGCKWISVETAEETAEHDAPSYRNMLRYGFRLLYKRMNYVFTPSS